MTTEFLTGFFFEAIKTAIMLAAPMLLAGLLVGLLVSIFQSATSINEMTLTFIPKMLAVACALLFFLPWMMQTMLTFTTNLLNNIVIYIYSLMQNVCFIKIHTDNV
jgi:flagellar biosynthetic protein FliQ